MACIRSLIGQCKLNIPHRRNRNLASVTRNVLRPSGSRNEQPPEQWGNMRRGYDNEWQSQVTDGEQVEIGTPQVKVAFDNNDY